MHVIVSVVPLTGSYVVVAVCNNLLVPEAVVERYDVT
jgi:hypothetical protein